MAAMIPKDCYKLRLHDHERTLPVFPVKFLQGDVDKYLDLVEELRMTVDNMKKEN